MRSLYFVRKQLNIPYGLVSIALLATVTRLYKAHNYRVCIIYTKRIHYMLYYKYDSIFMRGSKVKPVKRRVSGNTFTKYIQKIYSALQLTTRLWMVATKILKQNQN